MTAPTLTRPAPAAPTGLRDALDELSRAAAEAGDDRCSRAALGLVAREVEALAAAPLDDDGTDVPVVLQRRIGRAAGHLLRTTQPVDVAHLRALTRTLQPATRDRVRPGAQPTRATVLAGC